MKQFFTDLDGLKKHILEKLQPLASSTYASEALITLGASSWFTIGIRGTNSVKISKNDYIDIAYSEGISGLLIGKNAQP